MGIFGDLDIESAADNLWPIDDTYRCILTDVKTVASKKTEDLPEDEQELYWVLEYTIQDGDYESMTLVERKRIPRDNEMDTAAAKRNATYIKMRLKSLGVPESRMNSIENDELIGIECAVSCKANKDPNYPPNVVKVELLMDAPY